MLDFFRPEQENTVPISLILLLVALAVISTVYFFLSFQKHSLGKGAEERAIDIRILDKQSVALPSPEQHEDPEEYWIYVQPLAGGPKREFQVGVHYYHALQPGDCGTLTYKGLQFLHFAKLQRVD
nr:DUF2500 domain-containing protein [Enterovibrio baiacu]